MFTFRITTIFNSTVNKNVAKNLGPTLLSMSGPSDKLRERVPSPISRPGSSEGSTTVSATSSPGVDQQEHEELNSISMGMRMPEMTFKTVEELYPTPQAPHIFQQQNSTSSSSNGHTDETVPRKKSRKQQLYANLIIFHLLYIVICISLILYLEMIARHR